MTELPGEASQLMSHVPCRHGGISDINAQITGYSPVSCFSMEEACFQVATLPSSAPQTYFTPPYFSHSDVNLIVLSVTFLNTPGMLTVKCMGTPTIKSTSTLTTAIPSADLAVLFTFPV